MLIISPKDKLKLEINAAPKNTALTKDQSVMFSTFQEPFCGEMTHL